MNKTLNNSGIPSNQTHQTHDPNAQTWKDQHSIHQNQLNTQPEPSTLINQLEELKKSCNDTTTLNSINQTLNYLKQKNTEYQQTPDKEDTQVAQHNNNQVDVHRNWDIFDNFRNSMQAIEKSFEDSIFSDTRRHSLFRNMLDNMKRDMELFDRDYDLGTNNRGFRDHFNWWKEHNQDLLERYKIDDKEPDDAVGVIKEVETHTVNGKTNARVRCEYKLKDGSRVSKVKEFVEDETKQIKE